MSWRDAILDKYWQHLWKEHRFDENFDINLEIQIMTDYVKHGTDVADRDIIVIQCDKIGCNHKQRYHVIYHVVPLEEEE